VKRRPKAQAAVSLPNPFVVLIGARVRCVRGRGADPAEQRRAFESCLSNAKHNITVQKSCAEVDGTRVAVPCGREGRYRGRDGCGRFGRVQRVGQSPLRGFCILVGGVPGTARRPPVAGWLRAGLITIAAPRLVQREGERWEVSRTDRKRERSPRRRTAASRSTETPCRRSNSARRGSL